MQTYPDPDLVSPTTETLVDVLKRETLASPEVQKAAYQVARGYAAAFAAHYDDLDFDIIEEV